MNFKLLSSISLLNLVWYNNWKINSSNKEIFCELFKQSLLLLEIQWYEILFVIPLVLISSIVVWS